MVLAEVDSWYAWVVVFGSFLTSFVMGVNFVAAGVFFSTFREVFQTSRFVTAIYPAIIATFAMGGGVPTGMLIGRFGERSVGLLGAFFLILALSLTSFVRSIYTLILTQGVLLGFGIVLVYTPGSYVVNKWHSKRRAFAVGISSTGAGVGAIVCGPLVQWLYPAVGWRVMMRIFAGLIGTISLLGTMTFIPINISANPSFDVKDALSYKEICSIKAMRYFLIVVFLLPLIYPCILVHIIDYALSIGVSSSVAYNLLIYWGIASVCGRVLSGIFSPTNKKKRLWTDFYVFTAICCSNFSFPFLVRSNLFSSPMPWFIIFMLVHGFFIGSWIQLLSVVLADVFGVENLHKTIGLEMSIQIVLAIIGAPLAGFIADKTSNFYEYVFLGVGSIIVVPFKFLFVRESLKLERMRMANDSRLLMVGELSNRLIEQACELD